MKFKKVLAVMLSFMMLVYTASDIAYAAESDSQDQNTDVTVNADEEITEVDEGEIIPLVSSEEPIDGNSFGGKFIYDLGVEAYDFVSVGNMTDHGYTKVGSRINPVDDGISVGKNISLGVKYVSADQFDSYKDKLITGILIYKTYEKPENLEWIYWQGKVYEPVLNWYDVSNGDLNQEAGGAYLYLYYTTQGVEDGDPVLYKIDTSFGNKSYLEQYFISKYNEVNIVRDMDDQSKFANLDEGVTYGAGYKADLNIMAALYHYHTPVQYDRNYHWCDCEGCSYHIEKEKHDLQYKTNPGSDGTHLIYCTDKRCSYEEAVPHVDKDEDGICDFCNAGRVAAVNGQYFSSFEGAWEHATNMDHDATITLCEDTYASEDGNPLYLNGGNTVTIKGDGHTLKTCGSNPFNVRDGKLVIATDIEYVGDNLDKLAYAYTDTGEIYFKSGKITVAGERATDNCCVLYADKGATMTATGGSIEITGNEKDITGIAISNGYAVKAASNPNTILNLSDDINVSGGNCAVSVAESKDASIEGGTYSAQEYGIKLTDTARVKISGGTFHGTDYGFYAKGFYTAVISGGTFSSDTRYSMYTEDGGLKILLKKGYCLVDADTGKIVSLKDNARWYQRAATVKIHENHTGSVRNGICVICGAEIGEDEGLDDGKIDIENASISGIPENPGSMKKKLKDMKVILNGETLVEGTDYTVSYKNGLKGGYSSVTITGMGEYTGSVTKIIKNNQGKDNKKK